MLAGYRALVGNNEVVDFVAQLDDRMQPLYDPTNKGKAVEILVKYTKSPPDDIAKSYDSFYGADKIMSQDLELTEKALQPWLDLRGSSEKPARYIDLSYWKRALGR